MVEVRASAPTNPGGRHILEPSANEKQTKRFEFNTQQSNIALVTSEEDSGSSNNSTMDGLDFFFNAEQEGNGGGGGAGVRFRTSFYAKNVNVLMAPMTDNLGRHGRNVVDRGHALLQREIETDYLRLAFFKREAHSEHVDPLVVLPIGFIMKTDMQAVASPMAEFSPTTRLWWNLQLID